MATVAHWFHFSPTDLGKMTLPQLARWYRRAKTLKDQADREAAGQV